MGTKIEATAVFDIGKTNKKFFLFDEDLNEIHNSYHRLEYTVDEDGFSSESLPDLTGWIRETLLGALGDPRFNIRRLNFTTYGATMVHLGDNGQPVTPVYNYLKPFPDDLMCSFRDTASPQLGMLNSGLQLYWLKHTRPAVFRKIHISLHLPQYLSYLYHGVLSSEYTSAGCHTALWDFRKNGYHSWLDQESMRNLFPEAGTSDRYFRGTGKFADLRVGVGIHDSSAALLPYLLSKTEPFILLSTGTWGISINPFNTTPLTAEELQKDCLCYLGTSGNPVKASRLFIGEEHKFQIGKMYAFFDLPQGTYKKLRFREDLYTKVISDKSRRFRFRYLKPEQFGIDAAQDTDLSVFPSFEEAYYTFLHELTDLQCASLRLVLTGNTTRVYIDGGFNSNDVFTRMLSKKLEPLPVLTCDFALGTALGAALLIQDEPVRNKFRANLPSQIEFRSV